MKPWRRSENYHAGKTANPAGRQSVMTYKRILFELESLGQRKQIEVRKWHSCQVPEKWHETILWIMSWIDKNERDHGLPQPVNITG
jgi:hypothetical protein